MSQHELYVIIAAGLSIVILTSCSNPDPKPQQADKSQVDTVSPRDPGRKEAAGAGDMIDVESPASGTKISSPLTVKGKAKGYWYHEGMFTIKLYDTATDSLLAKTTAEADGKWMTEQFVPFEATLTFKARGNQRGRLVFERANPSGLPQNEQSYSVPVIFSSR